MLAEEVVAVDVDEARVEEAAEEWDRRTVWLVEVTEAHLEGGVGEDAVVVVGEGTETGHNRRVRRQLQANKIRRTPNHLLSPAVPASLGVA